MIKVHQSFNGLADPVEQITIYSTTGKPYFTHDEYVTFLAEVKACKWEPFAPIGGGLVAPDKEFELGD